ncbi:MAG: hypothetical protein J6Z11_05765, partial [Candidatus Riflebacteria bacterium]|nr:hypothetical protein [Candidatus Riflebacteria bacterium]
RVFKGVFLKIYHSDEFEFLDSLFLKGDVMLKHDRGIFNKQIKTSRFRLRSTSPLKRGAFNGLLHLQNVTN